ncbi:MAG: polysaccharide biosynthesis/export family protein [Planctomycetaceae bacterium]|nr:polysaccharide biosynthesis/export family protein [Planctomycetaceae bacterium]
MQRFARSGNRTGGTARTSRPAWRLAALLIGAPIVASLGGCAAARPLDGVPASQTSWENRAWERSGRDTIDLALLGQSPPAEHLVDVGDTLGIYIDGVLGSCQCEQAIPIYHPSDREQSPSVGFPIPVRSDGTISLPMVAPLSVRGLSLLQVEDLIRRTYTVDKPLLQPGKERVLVSLQKPRSVRVLVIRQESSLGHGATGSSLAPENQKDKRGTGKLVILPAYRNDVLNAMAETGGLPGTDARNTVYIFRRGGPGNCAAPGYSQGPVPFAARPAPAHRTPLDEFGHSEDANPVQQTSATDAQPFQAMPFDNSIPPSFAMGDPTIRSARVTKIPLRLGPNEPACFGPADVLLNDGDVVFIESREPDVFYTGGLLGSSQWELPRDYDVNVLDAIALAEGNRSRNSTTYPPNKAIGGISALNQDVSVGASKVIVQRTLPNGSVCNIEVDLHKAMRDPAERILIRPGDRLILQYTRCEATAAFFERYVLEGVVLGAASGLVFGN